MHWASRVMCSHVVEIGLGWGGKLCYQWEGQEENHQFSSVQSLSHVQLLATPWTAARQASLSITNFQSLLKLMSTESVMPSNHLILCCPLLLPPSIFPSIRVFSNESVLQVMWTKYWSFSFSISPSNEYSGLVSFRTDWLDLLCSPRNSQDCLLQHHTSKASILQQYVFYHSKNWFIIFNISVKHKKVNLF